MGYPVKKKKGRVAIPIKGVGTFYLTRKQTGILALASFGMLCALGWFLFWIQTQPVCNFVAVGC